MNDLVDAFFAALNAHDVEGMAACCTAAVVADEVAEPEPFNGAAALQQAYREVFAGYPDCAADMLERYADGDNAICQMRWTATNSGSFRGAAPTGKPVQLRLAYFVRFKGGKIDRITEYYDVATLLAQQGQLEL